MYNSCDEYAQTYISLVLPRQVYSLLRDVRNQRLVCAMHDEDVSTLQA